MSWSFLNSAVLWAIPLSLAPLLLHLLFRKPPKIVAFSDLRFLRTVYERYRPRRKLQEWIILLLRVLALLALFLFFSRPVLHLGGRPGADDTVALVILLDASYSMRAQVSGLSHWDRSVRLAGKTLLALRESDRSSLVIFSDRIEHSSGYLTNLHEELAGTIKSFQPTFRNTSVLPALQAAYRLLSNSGASNKSILIFSDMAGHGWGQKIKEREGKDLESWEARIKDFDSEVRIIHVKLPPLRRNAAIKEARMLPDLYTGLLKVQIDVENTGTEAITDLPVTMDFFDWKGSLREGYTEHRYSETLVRLDPGEKKTVTLSAPLTEGMALSGKIDLRSDGLPADNRHYFSQVAPQRVRVLFVEEPTGIAALSGESYFLRQALTSPPSPFEVTTITLGEIPKSDLSKFDTVALVNLGEIGESASRVLNGYLARGGSLFLAVGPRVAGTHSKDLGPEQRRFLEALPCTMMDVRETTSLKAFPNPEIDDPLFSGFKSEYEWDRITIHKIVQPVIKEDADPWILLSDGTPLLIFSADRRKAVMLSTVNRDWNNLASKPVFAPLSRFIMGTLSDADRSDRKASLTVGAFLTRTYPTLVREGTVSLVSFDAEELSVRASQKDVVSPPLERPGVYALVRRDGNRSSKDFYSVNIDAGGEESDLTPISGSSLDRLIPTGRKVALEPGEQFLTEVLAALRGKELSRLFLIFAGLFLLGEMLLVSRKKT